MRLRSIALAAGLALCAGAGAAQDETPSLTHDFGDWNVACDNVRGCTAVGFAADAEGGAGPHLFLARGGGVYDQPRVEIGIGFGSASEAVMDGDAIEVAVDGARPLRFTAVARRGRESYDWPELVFPAERTAAFVEAVIQGERITLTHKGKPLGAISLKGSSAALRWIDAEQKRDGGRSALVAVGPRPAKADPAPPDPPTVRRAPPISQSGSPRTMPPALAGREDVRLCAEEYDEESRRPPTAWRLSKTEYLWHIPCGSGAYNFNALFLIARRDGTGARSAGVGGPSDPDYLTNGSYDPKTRLLSAFSKGRGLGDCGDDSAWAWDGRSFRRTHQAVMESCMGVTIEHWHVIWRARVL